MKQNSVIMAIVLFALVPQVAAAQPITHTSIPSSAFQGEGSSQNVSGTARFNAPRSCMLRYTYPRARGVTSLSCGGRASFNKHIVFTLRRNDPQQANVDLATTQTTLAGTGFEFVFHRRHHLWDDRQLPLQLLCRRRCRPAWR